LYLRGTVFGRKLAAILNAIPDDGNEYGSYAIAKKLGRNPQTVSNMLNDLFVIGAMSERYSISKNSLGTIRIRKKTKGKPKTQEGPKPTRE
jgi:hypothetical protein